MKLKLKASGTPVEVMASLAEQTKAQMEAIHEGKMTRGVQQHRGAVINTLLSHVNAEIHDAAADVAVSVTLAIEISQLTNVP